MSIHDETWDRPICNYCKKTIKYGESLDHIKCGLISILDETVKLEEPPKHKKTKIKRPSTGLSKKCEALLEEVMTVNFQTSLSLVEKRWFLHNIIDRAYKLGVERGIEKQKTNE